MLALTSLFALSSSLLLAHAAPAQPRQIHVLDNPNNQLIYAGRDNLCLSLLGGINATSVTDGTPVVSWPCDFASTWIIHRGEGKIVLYQNQGFALDIGTTPGNNGALKVWSSIDGAAAQDWYYTDDNRIANTGGTQCLDEGDNGVQTYQCTTGNTNQIWYTTSPSPGNSPTPETTLMYPTPAGTTAAVPVTVDVVTEPVPTTTA